MEISPICRFFGILLLLRRLHTARGGGPTPIAATFEGGPIGDDEVDDGPAAAAGGTRPWPWTTARHCQLSFVAHKQSRGRHDVSKKIIYIPIRTIAFL
jgi:hypothetical protein